VTRPTLATERLILRSWQESDLAPFAALNADARVMEYMPALLDRAASDALVARAQAHFDRRGFGPWAVELRSGLLESDGAPLIGFVGLMVPSFQARFTPCVEIGWRLAFAHWGQGYATEAARAALDFGFATAGLDEIVSFTSVGNTRSRAVMERLGMTRDPADDFDHPNLPPELPGGHALRRHVLYRLARRGRDAAR
jgi:RimJ/RimL family protein N-acetyltransferase